MEADVRAIYKTQAAPIPDSVALKFIAQTNDKLAGMNVRQAHPIFLHCPVRLS